MDDPGRGSPGPQRRHFRRPQLRPAATGPEPPCDPCSGKVPRGLKPRGFPDDPSPRFRGGIQARVSSSGVLTCRLCRVSRRGCVVSILRSPRLVSWGSSPGVPDPWYWLTFYAGSLPVPATAYVRRLDRTGNGPVIKDRLFLSTFVGAASSTALERAWHPPRFIGESPPRAYASLFPAFLRVFHGN